MQTRTEKVDQSFKRVGVLPSLVALMLCTGLALPVRASVLLSENFDSVPPTSPPTYTSTLINPTSDSAIAIRSAGDAVNTSSTDGFNGFFGSDPNQFLTMGTLGNAVGGSSGQLYEVQFDLGLFGTDPNTLSISFDYAFDTNLDPGSTGAANGDLFFATLVDETNAPVGDMLEFFNGVLRGDPGSRGTLSQTDTFSLANPGRVSLAFVLFQADADSASGVGVDNLLVTQDAPLVDPAQGVPEPGSSALLALGLLGLTLVRSVAGAKRQVSTCTS